MGEGYRTVPERLAEREVAHELLRIEVENDRALSAVDFERLERLLVLIGEKADLASKSVARIDDLIFHAIHEDSD